MRVIKCLVPISPLNSWVDSMANTCEEKDSEEINTERRDSKESSIDEEEYKCQKWSCLFDNKTHQPLCLPSGHFFWKQCIIKMQIK